MEEIYKDIPGFEGMYQVSNFGNVRSLDRVTISKRGTKMNYKGKVLVIVPNGRGYMKVILCKEGKSVVKKIHSLVWMCFGDGTPIKYPDTVIDHIDKNSLNNHIDNLRVVTNRQNCWNRIDSAKFTGVLQKKNKYQAKIKVNYVEYYLGSFETPEAAYQRYLDAISYLNNDFLSWYKTLGLKTKISKKTVIKKKIKAQIIYKYHSYTLGRFKTKEEADKIYAEAKAKVAEGVFLEWYTSLNLQRGKRTSKELIDIINKNS